VLADSLDLEVYRKADAPTIQQVEPAAATNGAAEDNSWEIDGEKFAT
jgi:hypothetical protein